jgi:hypothetical protein
MYLAEILHAKTSPAYIKGTGSPNRPFHNKGPCVAVRAHVIAHNRRLNQSEPVIPKCTIWCIYGKVRLLPCTRGHPMMHKAIICKNSASDVAALSEHTHRPEQVQWQQSCGHCRHIRTRYHGATYYMSDASGVLPPSVTHGPAAAAAAALLLAKQ